MEKKVFDYDYLKKRDKIDGWLVKNCQNIFKNQPSLNINHHYNHIFQQISLISKLQSEILIVCEETRFAAHLIQNGIYF